MKPLPSLLLAVFLSHVVAAADATSATLDHLDAVFAELRALKPMQSRERYTLPAGGKELSGFNDDFLRRRTSAEIRASGLSCGCGDYALLFIDRMTGRGFEALLIDSAQISTVSLANTFAGHAVAAIRPKGAPDASWWLIDSTTRKILSREWSPQAKMFSSSGSVYWIGYCGPAGGYPVRTPTELKRFYADTLATVPPDVFNRTLYRFVFTIDRSLIGEKGEYLNPRVVRLGQEQERIFAKYGIKPEREVAILLTRGEDNATGDLKHTASGWVSRVGLQSACSPSFLSYMEGAVRRHEQSDPR